MLFVHPESVTLLRRIDAGKPIFVCFTGDWCAACKAQKPFFIDAAQAFAQEADFALVEVAQEPGLAQDCGVSRLPAVVFFKGGDDLEMLSGRFSPSELLNFVKKSLKLENA